MKKRFFVFCSSGVLATVLGISMSIAAITPPTRESAVAKYSPRVFLDRKVKEMVAAIQIRTPYSSQEKVEIAGARDIKPWMAGLYKAGLIEASELTRDLTDKLLVYKAMEALVGAETAQKYHPKTMGLKELFEKHHLLDSKKNLIRDRQKILAAIQKEFPLGAIVKPATGLNSEGKSKGFYFKIEKFLNDLLAENTDLYSVQEYSEPFVSQLVKTVASGEKLIFQENVITAAGVTRPLKVKELLEVRVHTLEGKILKGGTFPRWRELDSMPAEVLSKAEQFIQEFLDAMPKQFTAKQAWSIDVAVMDNGVMRMIEINNNRGRTNHWSGFLPRPGVLGSYTRQIEATYPIRFTGFSGFLIRNDLGNIPRYLRKKYIEKEI